jgi:hypothetical protein
MKLTPEQHLSIVRQVEQKANAANDPAVQAQLKRIAKLGRFVAKVGRKQRATEASKTADAAISKARLSAKSLSRKSL